MCLIEDGRVHKDCVSDNDAAVSCSAGLGSHSPEHLPEDTALPQR